MNFVLTIVFTIIASVIGALVGSIGMMIILWYIANKHPESYIELLMVLFGDLDEMDGQSEEST